MLLQCGLQPGGIAADVVDGLQLIGASGTDVYECEDCCCHLEINFGEVVRAVSQKFGGYCSHYDGFAALFLKRNFRVDLGEIECQ